MNFPEDLKYTKEHEWIRLRGNMAIIGITDYAQEQLGEVVFIELPDEGEEITKDDSFGVVESVKSVSDIYAPVSGRIVEVNDPLLDNPETLNEEPYGEGWLIKVEVANPAEVEELLTSDRYQSYIKEEQA
ncbi:MAG: glycine cleavage system protein GcvH [Deltaproteobacteria bacterium]|nr:glycine cleavage system protein GcvH [Deltaproteobacteria bacterium]